MKRLIWLIGIMILAGCKKEDTASANENDIVGKWLRVEQYVNTGNNGRWVQTNDVPPVTVEFTAEGKIFSNHPLYSNYTGYQKIGTGSIEITNSGSSKLLNEYSFENGKLTILYTCREGCGDRFTKQ